MAIITSKSLPNNVRKEIDNIYRVTLADSPSEYDKVLKIESAPVGPNTFETEITGMGLPTELAEGAGVRYDVPVEGFGIMRSYKQFGLGYIITELMLQDELYGKMKKLPADLARSMRILTDIEGLRWYNEAHSNSLCKDKTALASNAGHSLLNDIGVMEDGNFYAGGVLFNVPAVPGALSETTFKQYQEYQDEMVDENGYPVIQEIGSLLVNKDDSYVAHRLKTMMYGSSLVSGGLGHIPGAAPTAGSLAYENMGNFANAENGFVKQWNIIPSRYLDSGRWFGLSTDHDNKMYWKTQPKQTSEPDFDTDNIKYKSKMRFGVWGNEYRGTYGNIIGNDR